MENYDTNIITDEGRNFPKPIKGLEWNLRYGDAIKVRLNAASIVSAYNALINLPLKESRLVLKQLKQAIKND